MSRIRIRHTTRYEYTHPVTLGPHRLVLRPREGHDVHVEAQTLSLIPEAHVHWHRDLFGNSIATAGFSTPSPLLEIVNDVLVGRRDTPPVTGRPRPLRFRLFTTRGKRTWRGPINRRSMATNRRLWANGWKNNSSPGKPGTACV